MKLDQITEMTNLMYLFKGESGTGKSIALASFPTPMKILSFDGRIEPLLHYPGIDIANIDVDIFTRYDKACYVLESLVKLNEFSTVVLDPLTGFARVTMGHLFENRGIAKSSEDEKYVGSSVGGIPVMGINEYKGETAAIAGMLLMLRILKNKGANVIMTAHVITNEQRQLDGKYLTTRRILTGGQAIAAEVHTYFDEVYHFYGPNNFNRSYRAVTSNTGEDDARTSFYGLKNEIDFTDKLFYKELKDAIKEVKTEQEFSNNLVKGE